MPKPAMPASSFVANCRSKHNSPHLGQGELKWLQQPVEMTAGIQKEIERTLDATLLIFDSLMTCGTLPVDDLPGKVKLHQ